MNEIWTMGELLVEIMRPRAGMELYKAGEFLGPFPSGAPAIFVDTVAKLGHGSGIIGGVGDDDFGRCLLERLAGDGVNCKYVGKFTGISTGVAFVTYFDDGSRKFIFHIGNTPAAMAKSPDISDIDKPAFFHLMGCSLMVNDGFYDEIILTLKKFVQKGAKVSFDPNIRKELLGSRSIDEFIKPVMENCHVFMPGVDELLLVSGEKTVEAGVHKILSNGVTEIIALKRGRDGCTVYTKDEKFSLGVYAVEPLDPTGAGDCFDAGFLCGLLDNKPLIECAEIATAAASINTASFGPMEGNVSRSSVEEMVAGGNIDVEII